MVLVSLLLSRCFGTSPPTRFYLLSAIPERGRRPAPEQSLAIGVGPVSFPAYLDRPEIATGNNPNQLNFSEFHHWAEPLENNFNRVLGENLALLVPTDSVVSFPWDRSTRIGYQVKLDVIRFFVDQHNNSVLTVRWRIVDWKQRNTLMIRKSDSQVRVTATGYEAMVASQSRALARFSEEIASAIRLLAKLPGNHG